MGMMLKVVFIFAHTTFVPYGRFIATKIDVTCIIMHVTTVTFNPPYENVSVGVHDINIISFENTAPQTTQW